MTTRASIWTLVHRHALLVVSPDGDCRTFTSPPVAVGGDPIVYARELESLAAAIRAAAQEHDPSREAP